jgi:hypothetical protein
MSNFIGQQAIVIGARIGGLAPDYFAEVSWLVETPWAAAAIPDFVHPDTRGERPADFEQTLKFGIALGKPAARDPAVHRLTAEVQHLLKPRNREGGRL